MSQGPLLHPPEALLLGFARALRAAGLPVTADRERTFLFAVAEVGLDDGERVRVAGRATLCATPQDLDRYDRVYAAWFGGPMGTPRPARVPTPTATAADLEDSTQDDGLTTDSNGEDAEIARVAASGAEVLRHRDVAEVPASEKRRLTELFAHIRPTPPTRRALRHTASRTGPVDGRAMLRDQYRQMGEPGPVRHHRRGQRARRVVLLVDVSGSMSGYADALLRLAHRFVRSRGPVEVFTIGTRLTHVTRALRQPDADRAIVDAGKVVPDWSGGTRLGEGIGAFLDLWGRRGMARGAVVVVFSDGWEREGPDLLAEQMRRLAAVAHRVVWVNPHRGKPGYLPVQQGMAAALPFCDEFLAGHSIATFEKLTEVVAHA